MVDREKYKKEYYQKNKEKIKARQKEYYQRNKEKLKIQQREFNKKQRCKRCNRELLAPRSRKEGYCVACNTSKG